jgi:putative addiction module CopG family antidote
MNSPQIKVTVTQEMAAFVRATMENGNYSSVSEVVREALRDWRMRAGDRGLLTTKLAERDAKTA